MALFSGGGGKLLNVKYVFWFFIQFLFETFLILRWNQRDTAIDVNTCSCTKYPLFLSEFNETWKFLTSSKKSQIWNFIRVRPREPSCSIRTDMTKLIVAFRNFVNAPEKNALRGATSFRPSFRLWQYSDETVCLFHMKFSVGIISKTVFTKRPDFRYSGLNYIHTLLQGRAGMAQSV